SSEETGVKRPQIHPRGHSGRQLSFGEIRELWIDHICPEQELTLAIKPCLRFGLLRSSQRRRRQRLRDDVTDSAVSRGDQSRAAAKPNAAEVRPQAPVGLGELNH